MDLISKLSKKDLVIGLPKLRYKKDSLRNTCQLGKQTRVSFKSKNDVSTSRPLELLHMNLFGPTKTTSLGGKKYALVIIDDYSRYTWTLFLAHKYHAFHSFSKLCRKIQNEKGYTVVSIRSDKGREFDC